MSIQKYIQKYIIMNIDSNKIKPGDKIPSENQIAIKFNCSRLTARHALQKLVASGVLKSIRGKGYIVNDNTNTHYLKSWGVLHDVAKTELDIIKKVDKKIIELLQIGDEKILSFVKRYYDKDNHLLSAQFTILNKDIIWEKNYDAFQKSITDELLSQGIFIERNDYIFKFVNVPKILNKYRTELGFKGDPLVEISTSYSSQHWIEKTIRITHKDILEITTAQNKFI